MSNKYPHPGDLKKKNVFTKKSKHFFSFAYQKNVSTLVVFRGVIYLAYI